MILKPAESTPLTALALAELAHRAGIPDGVLNILVGDAKAIGEDFSWPDLLLHFEQCVSLTAHCDRQWLKRCLWVWISALQVVLHRGHPDGVGRCSEDRVHRLHQGWQAALCSCSRHRQEGVDYDILQAMS